MRFIDDTQLDTDTHTHTQTRARAVGLLRRSEQSVTEAATNTTHNKQTSRTCLLLAGLESVMPANTWLQTYALDRMTTRLC